MEIFLPDILYEIFINQGGASFAVVPAKCYVYYSNWLTTFHRSTKIQFFSDYLLHRVMWKVCIFRAFIRQPMNA